MGLYWTDVYDSYRARVSGGGGQGERGQAELTEARQLNRRYRDALQTIRERPVPWCSDYAECDHEGCKASHRAFEIATNALDVESSF